MSAIQLLSRSVQTEIPSAGKVEAKLTKAEGMQAAFSNYMQQSSANGAQIAKQQTVNTIEQPSKASNNSSVQQDYAQSQSKAAAQAEKVTSTNGKDQNADEQVSAEVSGAVEETAEAVKDIIKEELGVDDKQLEEAMELLGMTQADLLDPQQLTALAVELTGSQDAGMMLFSESFQNVMQQVSVVTEDLLKDLGMTMDQLMDQIGQMDLSMQPDMDTEMMPQMQQAVEAPVTEVPETSVSEQTEAVQTPQTSDVPQEVQVVQTVEVTPDTSGQLQEVEAQTQSQAQMEEKQQQIQEQPEELQEQPKAVQEQQTVQTEEDTQTGEEGSALSDGTQADTGSRNMQQDAHTVFDFHADVHQGQQIDPPVTNSVADQTPLPQVNVEDVIRQIAEYTRIHLTENVKSIEMQLNPANLGKVFLHVTEKAGTITAQLTAQDENVKEALMQQAAVLKDNLNQQGIKINAVEVSVGTHEFESNLEKDAHQQEEQARQQEEQNSRRSRRGINLNELEDLDGLSGLLSEEEALVAQIMRDNGNNVDFKA